MNLLVPGEFLLLMASFFSRVTVRTNLTVSCLFFFKKKSCLRFLFLGLKVEFLLEHIGSIICNLLLSK